MKATAMKAFEQFSTVCSNTTGSTLSTHASNTTGSSDVPRNDGRIAAETLKIPEGKCAVCLDSLKNKPFEALLCGHSFHTECLDKTMETIHVKKKLQLSCPLCRTTGVELKAGCAHLMKTAQTMQNGDEEERDNVVGNEENVWAKADTKKPSKLMKLEKAANCVMCNCATFFTSKDVFQVLKHTHVARTWEQSVMTLTHEVTHMLKNMSLILETRAPFQRIGKQNRYFRKRNQGEIEASEAAREQKEIKTQCGA